MPTPARRSRVSAATWAQRVLAWQQSGRSASAFAAPQGFDPRQLSWWRWALARRSSSSSPRSVPRSVSVPSFLPVHVLSALAPAPTDLASSVEILLGNGRRVAVRGTVDARLLTLVLACAERA